MPLCTFAWHVIAVGVGCGCAIAGAALLPPPPHAAAASAVSAQMLRPMPDFEKRMTVMMGMTPKRSERTCWYLRTTSIGSCACAYACRVCRSSPRRPAEMAAGQDVKVEMVDRLSGLGAVVDDDPEVAILDHLRRDGQQPAEQL